MHYKFVPPATPIICFTLFDQNIFCFWQVYFRQNFEPAAKSQSDDSSQQLEDTVAELKQNQKLMMKLLREQQDRTKEQQERAKEQMEINQMLRDFILKSTTQG